MDSGWRNVSVKIPKSKPNAKGLYLKDRHEGNFLLVWREGGRKRYSTYIASLPETIRAKDQKELYLASLAKGLKVRRPERRQDPSNRGCGY
jgi:hypothetical protein